jgi:hypothetical protein
MGATITYRAHRDHLHMERWTVYTRTWDPELGDGHTVEHSEHATLAEAVAAARTVPADDDDVHVEIEPGSWEPVELEPGWWGVEWVACPERTVYLWPTAEGGWEIEEA